MILNIIINNKYLWGAAATLGVLYMYLSLKQENRGGAHYKISMPRYDKYN
jgi:hypothetical protein